jgi:hypothetical protein
MLTDRFPGRTTRSRPRRRPCCGPVSLFLAALAPITLAGCASPGIEVTSISIEDRSTQSVKLGVDVNLTNPADAPMRLLRWDYTFSSGSESYRGTWEALTTIPPQTTLSRRIPVVLPASVADGPWSVSGSLSYRSPSRLAEIFYDLGVWRPRTGFGGTGSGSAPTSSEAGQ